MKSIFIFNNIQIFLLYKVIYNQIILSLNKKSENNL